MMSQRSSKYRRRQHTSLHFTVRVSLVNIGTYMFLCEDTRSFNHFPIMLANSIARQLITGTVIPFHIHMQLHNYIKMASCVPLSYSMFFFMGQVLPHASPVFSQKPVFFFIFSVNFPLSTFWTLLRYPEFHHLSRNFQPKQRPNAVKHRTRHRGMQETSY